MECKNCSNKFEGNFCNNCGQSAKVDRINWKYLVNSISESVLQIDRGFLYTAKILLLRPKKSLNDFFAGKRKRLSKPFTFLLVSAAILLISTKIIGSETFVDDFLNGYNAGFEGEPKDKLNLKLTEFLTKNQTYIFLFTVPIFSIASFLSFRKHKYNFSEHLILNLFITGEQLLIYSIFSFIKDRDLAMLPLTLGVAYNIYVYNVLFDKISRVKRNFNLFITYILYLILIFLALLLMIAIINMMPM